MAYTRRLSWMSYCMCRLLSTKGLRSCAYSMAFSRGKPFEWNETRQSQIGQFCTGSRKITFSSKVTSLMNSNSPRRVNISFMGFDCVFLAMAQMPTTTCLLLLDEVLVSESMPSLLSPKSVSPFRMWEEEMKAKLLTRFQNFVVSSSVVVPLSKAERCFLFRFLLCRSIRNNK